MQEPRAWTITLMFFFFLFPEIRAEGGGGGKQTVYIQVFVVHDHRHLRDRHNNGYRTR